MKSVLSTMTTGVMYQEYTQRTENDMPVCKRKVHVNGGANLKSVRSGFGDFAADEMGIPMWTPRGVVTQVSDEDAAFLVGHPTFKEDAAAGFVVILDKAPGSDHEKIKKLVNEHLKAADGSAPLTGDTYGKVKVVQNSAEG